MVNRIIARNLLALLLSLVPLAMHAQEFKPYPRANITLEQWLAYYEEVRAKHGNDAQDIDAEKLVVYQDQKSATSYTFTKPSHPAHPAWITRQVREKDGKLGISQIGYFAGTQEPFAKLFRAYQQSNDRIRENVQNKGAAPPAGQASESK
jgi:hypothetical protein